MGLKDHFHEGKLTIDFVDRFSYADSTDFRKLLVLAQEREASQIIFNLSKLNYIDSAGLGMFLVTLKTCEDNGMQLLLRGLHGEVKNILDITQCTNRFNIES